MSYRPSTFSIVGWDPFEQELGVAVQSKFLAVGSVVPWAKAGVGAIATQSWANTMYGVRALELLAYGKSPQETIDILIGDDEDAESRQVGIVNMEGESAAFTGSDCFEVATHRTGEYFTCQGNLLANEQVVEAMAEAFETSIGDDLADRLIAALRAGQEAGGDSRGQQSAALLVVKEGGGYGGFNDRYIDLRVDDHPEPIEELARLLGLHKLYYPRPFETVLDLEGETLDKLAADLTVLGYLETSDGGEQYTQDDVVEALRRFSLKENLEERLRDDGEVYEAVLDFVHMKAEQQEG